MGFTVGRHVTLEFEGYMQGAVVTLRAASIDTMLKLRDSSIQEAIPLLAAHLVSWNLDYEVQDGKRSVPMTAEGIGTFLEAQMILKIVGEWYKVAAGISAPFDQPSDDGEPKPDTDPGELFIPMEALSPSL